MTQFKITKEFEKELLSTAKKIKEKNYKVVLLQLPDGLKDLADKIVDILEKEDLEVIIWGGSNWGGCDIPLHFKIENIVDCILHIGHTQFKKTKFYLQKD